MYKLVFFWVIILFSVNLLFTACTDNTAVHYPKIEVNDIDDLTSKNNDLKFAQIEKIHIEENCFKKNVNDFIKEYCDYDKDGLLNIQEKEFKTDPYDPDTDNDGYLDGEEIRKAYDPLGFGDLLPDKYKECKSASQAWCWSGQAYYRADPSICSKISDKRFLLRRKEKCKADAQKARDKINIEVALADLNIDECNNIKNEELLIECKKKLAFALGAVKANKNYCLRKFGFSKIKEDEKLTLAKELQHRCWFAMAVASNDIEACDKLDSHIVKEFNKIECVSRIARLNNNKNLCYRLEDMGLKDAVDACLGKQVLSISDLEKNK